MGIFHECFYQNITDGFILYFPYCDDLVQTIN